MITVYLPWASGCQDLLPTSSPIRLCCTRVWTSSCRLYYPSASHLGWPGSAPPSPFPGLSESTRYCMAGGLAAAPNLGDWWEGGHVRDPNIGPWMTRLWSGYQWWVQIPFLAFQNRGNLQINKLTAISEEWGHAFLLIMKMHLQWSGKQSIGCTVELKQIWTEQKAMRLS